MVLLHVDNNAARYYSDDEHCLGKLFKWTSVLYMSQQAIGYRSSYVPDCRPTTFSPLHRPRTPQCTALQTDGQTGDIMMPIADHTV